MTHQQRIRSGELPARSLAIVASIVSGISWLTWEVSRRAWDDGASSECATSAGYFNDATFLLANGAAAIALVALFLLFRGALRWAGLAAAIGAAAFGIGNLVEHCVAEPFFILFVAGGLANLLASCLLAAGILVTGQLGRWPGLLLGGAALGGIVLGFEGGGAAATGAAWVAFGGSLAIANAKQKTTERRAAT